MIPISMNGKGSCIPRESEKNSFMDSSAINKKNMKKSLFTKKSPIKRNDKNIRYNLLFTSIYKSWIFEFRRLFIFLLC